MFNPIIFVVMWQYQFDCRYKEQQEVMITHIRILFILMHTIGHFITRNFIHYLKFNVFSFFLI